MTPIEEQVKALNDLRAQADAEAARHREGNTR